MLAGIATEIFTERDLIDTIDLLLELAEYVLQVGLDTRNACG